jgi:hypothetical protein
MLAPNLFNAVAMVFSIELKVEVRKVAALA